MASKLWGYACLHLHALSVSIPSVSVSMPSAGDHAIFSQLSLSSVIILLGQKTKQVTLVPFGAFSISKNQMGIKRHRFLIKGITQTKLAHTTEREHQHCSCLEQQTPQLQGDHSHAEHSSPSLWSWAWGVCARGNPPVQLGRGPAAGVATTPSDHGASR